MIKVLESPTYKCTCKQCKSTLEYGWADIQKIKANQDYLGDFDLVHGIICPVCNNAVKVDIYGNS